MINCGGSDDCDMLGLKFLELVVVFAVEAGGKVLDPEPKCNGCDDCEPLE